MANAADKKTIVVHKYVEGEDLLTEQEYREVAYEAHQSKTEVWFISFSSLFACFSSKFNEKGEKEKISR